MLVPQFLATGPDPKLGWPAIAQLLAEVRAGNTAKLDELARTSAAFMTMASDDPGRRASPGGSGMRRRSPTAPSGSATASAGPLRLTIRPSACRLGHIPT